MPDHRHPFEAFSRRITNWTGSTPAFLLALAVILAWSMTGPLFHYSETWQLVINTGTTIVTFLMVFLIQRAQNKDSLALHLKLNELLSATKTASNRLVSVEDLDEQELQLLRRYYARLAVEARADADLHQTHTLAEAAVNQQTKKEHRHQRHRDRLRPTG